MDARRHARRTPSLTLDQGEGSAPRRRAGKRGDARGRAELNNQQELEAQTGRESYLLAEAGANPGSAGVVGKRDGALLGCGVVRVKV